MRVPTATLTFWIAALSAQRGEAARPCLQDRLASRGESNIRNPETEVGASTRLRPRAPPMEVGVRASAGHAEVAHNRAEADFGVVLSSPSWRKPRSLGRRGLTHDDGSAAAQEDPALDGQEEPFRDRPHEIPDTPPPDGAAAAAPLEFERPTFTSSPFLCGKGVGLVEAGLEFALENGGGRAQGNRLSLPLVLRYGISDTFEAFLKSDSTLERRMETRATGEIADGGGLEAALMGSKWSLLSEGELLPAISSVSLWSLPIQGEAFGMRPAEGDLRFITSLGKRLGLFEALGNTGVAFVEDPDVSNRFLRRYVGSIELRVPLEDALVFGEVFYLSSMQPLSGVQTAARMGGAYFLTRKIRLDVSIQVGLSGGAEDLVLGAGFTFALGRFSP
ncbi:MAG: hypothetical protein HY716_04075 [Planctomycetes bacterium]|nr:hypothetical protein [Planctomycetota bacterium]